MVTRRSSSRVVRGAALAAAGLALLAGGCGHVAEPWDKTGFFRQDRQRSPAREAELRERARLQADRTHS